MVCKKACKNVGAHCPWVEVGPIDGHDMDTLVEACDVSVSACWYAARYSRSLDALRAAATSLAAGLDLEAFAKRLSGCCIRKVPKAASSFG